MNDNMKKSLFQFLVTLCTGYFGIHKLINGQIGMGIAYFFTGGFFGIGWLYDTIVSGMDCYHIYSENREKQLESVSFPYISKQSESTSSTGNREFQQSEDHGDTAQNIAYTLIEFLNDKRGCHVILVDAQKTENGFDFIMEASSKEEAQRILDFEKEFNAILKDEFHFSYLYRSQFLIRLIPHSYPR